MVDMDWFHMNGLEVLSCHLEVTLWFRLKKVFV